MSEQKPMTAPQTPSEKIARQTAQVQADQGAYEKQMAAAGQGAAYSSAPALPSLPILFLRSGMRAELASKEYSEQRVQKAKALSDLREGAAVAGKKADNVARLLESAAAELKKREAAIGTDKDDVDKRMALMAKVNVLGKDTNRLQQLAGQARGSVSAAEAELHDPLCRWAEAKAEACRAWLPVIQADLKLAEEILEWKAKELKELRVHKDARTRAQIAKGKWPTPVPPEDPGQIYGYEPPEPSDGRMVEGGPMVPIK